MTRSSRTRLLSGAPEMSVELSQPKHGRAHVHMHTHARTHMHTHTRTPAALERSLLLHTGVIPEVYGVPAASEMRPFPRCTGLTLSVQSLSSWDEWTRALFLLSLHVHKSYKLKFISRSNIMLTVPTKSAT